MTDSPLGEIAPIRFLEEYWQRKPCLIRQACPDFEPPIDGDDLAGLACEDLAEARIVTGSLESGRWQLRTGPFDETMFAGLGDSDWTLLVQDVEKHYPPLQALLDRFDFLPTWRMDDLMVSFATPGGSVGPHVDQYDVFLLQAQGRRHWQIAGAFDPQLVPDCPLEILASFVPEQEWTLAPGDMLYLPPGVAHHGVALDPCLTYSIGLRAPSTADLLLALGEQLSGLADQGGRYRDGGLSAHVRPGEITPASLDRFRELTVGALHGSADFNDFVGAFLSRFRLAHEPMPAPGAPTGDKLFGLLEAGGELERHPWTRMNWLEHNGQARVFAAGQAYSCSIELATILCGAGPVRVCVESLDSASRQALERLVRDGQLIVVQ